jgi:hypothetical protein
MINFSFDIANIKVYSNAQANNIVGQVRLEIVGELNGKTQKNFFPVDLDAPDYQQFTEYQLLSKEQVMQWVMEKVGQDQIDALKEGIQGVLEYEPPEDAPPVLVPAEAPWNQTQLS